MEAGPQWECNQGLRLKSGSAAASSRTRWELSQLQLELGARPHLRGESRVFPEQVGKLTLRT